MQQLKKFGFIVPKGEPFEVLEITPRPGHGDRAVLLLKISDQAGRIGYVSLGTSGKGIEITNIADDITAWKLKNLKLYMGWEGAPEAACHQARVGMEFVQNFPNSEFVPEALKVAGECYWAAAGLYSYSLPEYRNKAASLSSLEQAKKILNDLVHRFPNNKCALEARKILEKIGRGEVHPYVEVNFLRRR